MQQIIDMFGKFANAAVAMLHMLSMRKFHQFRRRTKQVLDAISKFPKGMEVAITVLFLCMTLTYSLVLGGQGRMISENLATASGFSINSIRMSGQRETSETEILNALGISPKSSLLLFSVQEAKDRIERIHWVESASVQKLYPNGLNVVIEEKVPFALWQRNGRVSIIDRKGEVITDDFDSRYAGLPLVLGREANENAIDIINVLTRLPELNPLVRVRHFVSGRRWDLILANGMTLQLPEEGMVSALREFDAIVRKNGIYEKNIARIDMRLDDRIVFRLSESAFEIWESGEEAVGSPDMGDADS